MTETLRSAAQPGIHRRASRMIERVERNYGALSERDPRLRAFEIQFGDFPPRLIGRGRPAFRLTVNDRAGLAALTSMDEARIGACYLNGSLDVDGELLESLRLRPILSDLHPIAYLWATYLHPLLLTQTRSDRKWVKEHYDEEADFFLLFLDETRCYSHALFESENEPLSKAMVRKLDYAIEACGLEPGQRVLDIGGGWGAFTEHGSRRGLEVTSLTLSKSSEDYIGALIEREKLTCCVLLEHFLEHETNEKYDGIVNLGATEHLPDYRATLAQYQRLLKPGGRVYLDACAGRRMFPSTSFVYKYIFPGNASTLCLHDYLAEVARTPFELVSIHNDRISYMLTSRHWALNLERARDEIVRRWGERQYRKFRLFHWGCVYSFSTDQLSAYRMVLELPGERRVNTRLGGQQF